MTVNKEAGHFSSYRSGIRKLLVRSDVELPRQAETDRVELLSSGVEQFGHCMQKWMRYFHPLDWLHKSFPVTAVLTSR